MVKNISILGIALLLCGSAQAILIESNANASDYDLHVNNGAFSTGLLANQGHNESADSSMAQTMTTGASGFEFQNIHVVYSASNSVPVTLHIFEVADVAAGMLSVPGTTLVSETFDVPISADHLALLSIQLDNTVTLAANTGYAFYFDVSADGLIKEDGLTWWRSGSTSGDFYAGGMFYDEGEPKTLGTRDGLIALDAIPEPATLSFIAMFSIGLILSRRFK